MTTATPAVPLDPASYQGRYAGFVSRVAAGGIDVVLCATLSTGLVFFLQVLSAFLNAQPIGDATVDPDLTTVLISLLIAGYFTISWAVVARTAGEALLGLRVVRPNGRRVHLLRSFVRFVVGIFSFGFFFLGFFWMLIDNRRRSWPDIAARTVVIYDWDHRP